jgi:hypothetical protein
MRETSIAELVRCAAAPQPDNPGTPTRSRRTAIVDYTLLLLGLISLALDNHRVTWDGRHRYDALTQLLSGDGLSPDRYSLIGPVFAAPMW